MGEFSRGPLLLGGVGLICFSIFIWWLSGFLAKCILPLGFSPIVSVMAFILSSQLLFELFNLSLILVKQCKLIWLTYLPVAKLERLGFMAAFLSIFTFFDYTCYAAAFKGRDSLLIQSYIDEFEYFDLSRSVRAKIWDMERDYPCHPGIRIRRLRILLSSEFSGARQFCLASDAGLAKPKNYLAKTAGRGKALIAAKLMAQFFYPQITQPLSMAKSCHNVSYYSGDYAVSGRTTATSGPLVRFYYWVLGLFLLFYSALSLLSDSPDEVLWLGFYHLCGRVVGFCLFYHWCIVYLKCAEGSEGWIEILIGLTT